MERKAILQMIGLLKMKNISYDKLALYSIGRVCTREKTFPPLPDVET